MKKNIPYILLGLLVITLILIMVRGGSDADRKLDTRMSFRKRDKIPYGTFIAWENLSSVFPKARITSESGAPGYWGNLSEYGKGQALIIIAPNFQPEEEEMETLLRFVESGNDVFISTMSASFYLEKFIGCDIFYYALGYNQMLAREFPDSMTLSLTVPPGSLRKSFSYPGHDGGLWFHGIDTATSRVLGYNESGRPDFIGLNAGQGNLYLHLAPMAFTNYFLLHKSNMDYYDRALSIMSEKATTVVWDEYFISKRNEPPKPPNNWLTVLMNMENSEGKKSFQTAFLLLLGILLIYVLSEMRRKQRIIPVIRKPANASMDFVKTIGRLYHDKGDHANICRKMTAYFLEHVRSRYKLQTQHLNEQFIRDLTYKSGADEKLLKDIVGFIGNLHAGQAINAQSMAYFHDKLEQFYKFS